MDHKNIKVTVVDREGEEHELEAPLNLNFNLMEICKAADLPVKGTCGGMALCSTCHCYVLSEHDLPHMSFEEEDMLDQAFFVKENSRLSCQIPIEKELDNIKIQLAPESVL